MYYDPRTGRHGLPHDPFLALVAPRPIGWISTVSADGVPNLAPYSFFNAFSTRPHIVGFASSGHKDTLRNVAETGHFALNVVGEALARAMNATSAVVGREVDEFVLAGLAARPCRGIDVPRVADAPAVLECLHLQTVELRDHAGEPADSFLVLGEVVGIEIDEAILVEGLVDAGRLRHLSRLGYTDYAVVAETFAMARPK
ncbi:flavin reductase family protein [Oharaeibacter diazotrophicus]|uniref:Flavin reductase (DIM6/NTAB) family NADH-FMN oxidoreductase RutF n=1 Tax=Oharaeibacter diazotrophicus TaxID=1920512 RepID=A0A4R6R954_9HYPH|nr:flavin reductase family protein [Oharaeibacter diazotrophicus]TDP82573.1 flavin reductase (DIM6/NTAB) family NADH-FMN oxidoreductase RutF [Oharaeibacter diazotrophicus]BBE72663.1 flavin reductase like domain protein [Pleomorphomonas sp. SM30]GLS76697.1 flavin reductase [Oharaeibacter diazotrophicus]